MERKRNTSRLTLIGMVAGAACMVGSALSAETFLLMAEEEGCMWCARWNKDVSTEYPLTAEGRAAPLRRVDIHKTLPEGIELDSALRLTPTFVLVKDGREVSRIEGYPGEDFFWGLLNRMLTQADVAVGGEG